MDQAKHCWPRSEAMAAKDFNSWPRPKMSSTTMIIARAWSYPMFVATLLADKQQQDSGDCGVWIDPWHGTWHRLATCRFEITVRQLRQGSEEPNGSSFPRAAGRDTPTALRAVVLFDDRSQPRRHRLPIQPNVHIHWPKP